MNCLGLELRTLGHVDWDVYGNVRYLFMFMILFIVSFFKCKVAMAHNSWVYKGNIRTIKCRSLSSNIKQDIS